MDSIKTYKKPQLAQVDTTAKGSSELCPEAIGIAERQSELIDDVKALREYTETLKSDVSDMLTVFEELQSLFNALRKLGAFLRWLALTAAAVAALFASFTNFITFKH